MWNTWHVILDDVKKTAVYDFWRDWACYVVQMRKRIHAA